MKSITRATAPPTTSLVGVESAQLPATTGVERSIADAFQKWHPSAMDYAQWLVEDYDIAEDVVSEAAVRFFDRWEAMPLEQKTRTMFMSTVHHVATDIIRRAGIHVEYTAELEESLALMGIGPTPPIDEVTGDIDAAELIERAMARLPKQAKAVFQMRRIHGLSREETAAALCLTPKGVSTALGRADAYVRAALVRAGIQVKDGIISLRLTAGDPAREDHHE